MKFVKKIVAEKNEHALYALMFPAVAAHIGVAEGERENAVDKLAAPAHVERGAEAEHDDKDEGRVKSQGYYFKHEGAPRVARARHGVEVDLRGDGEDIGGE